MLRTFCGLAKFYRWSFDEIKSLTLEEYEAATKYIDQYNAEMERSNKSS